LRKTRLLNHFYFVVFFLLFLFIGFARFIFLFIHLYSILLLDCGIYTRTDGKLFNVTQSTPGQSKLQLQLIQELHADDCCVFFASSEADLQAITSSFACAATRFGLTINVSKTHNYYCCISQLQEPHRRQWHLFFFLFPSIVYVFFVLCILLFYCTNLMSSLKCMRVRLLHVH